MTYLVTRRYAVDTDWVGSIALTRQQDGATVFLQGEDADLFRRQLEVLEGLGLSPRGFAGFLDAACADYEFKKGL